MLKSLECDTAEYLASLMNGGSIRRRNHSGHCLRRSSLFTLYARIFKLLLTKWDKNPGIVDEISTEVDEYSKELDNLVLPSNEEWRLRVYYRLVELQRENDAEANANAEDDSMNENQTLTSRRAVKSESPIIGKKWEWEPNARVSYPLTPRSSRKFDSTSFSSASSVILESCVQPGWRLRDILLASKLLMNQEQDDYADEAEMRRVFGLVYDVLRYKQILDRALEDVGFWLRYAQLKRSEKVVWLLLYDMQGRKFARAGNSSVILRRNEELREAGLFEIEKALLDTKTRLAASLSRLRIGGLALSLDELLPAHLRTAEGVTWGEEGAIASGWVNSAKLPNRRQFVEEMTKLGLTLCTSCSATTELEEDQYVFDPLCPKVVNIHEKARERLAVSQLVRSYSFIFLERSLCVGAAALVHAIRVGKLCGPVILTHSLAPRHTGYLAELLADVEAGRLLAFGLGENRNQHQAYLEKLGISLQRCKLFSERYTSAPSSAEIERATIVLATPPCSYTGVRDVVDLAIARGGDLALLESLTSLEAESPQQPRSLLNEQMSTLKYALTRPNVQLLVYEVHTLLPSETTEMLEQAVEHANKMALDKFQKENVQQRKKSPPREATTGKKSKSSKRSQSIDQPNKSQHQSEESKTDTETEPEAPPSVTEIPIPESDLFEISDLNDLYEQDCSKLIDQGSFIVLVKRKEMMQFNSLFMIKVAEAKGVFGEPNKPTSTPKSPEMQQASQPIPEVQPGKKKKKKEKVQFERLTAPTHSTIVRFLKKKQPCPRHQQHVEHEETSIESQISAISESLDGPISSSDVPRSEIGLRVEMSVIDATVREAMNQENESTQEDEGKQNGGERDERDGEKLRDKLIFRELEKLRSRSHESTISNAFGVKVQCHESKTEGTTNSKDDLDELIHLSTPTLFFDSRDLAKKSSALSSRRANPTPTNFDVTRRKIDGSSPNGLLESFCNQWRCKPLPRKGSRLYRVKFRNSLETVPEHSPEFSYLF